MTRSSKHSNLITQAFVISQRGTCVRRQVGCVLVDIEGHTIGTGYNGPPSGWQHCTDVACPGATAASGVGLEICEAIHAEQNALLQTSRVRHIEAAYVTDAPCIHCTKLLLNTGCKRIYYARSYSASGTSLWLKAGREIIQTDPEPVNWGRMRRG